MKYRKMAFLYIFLSLLLLLVSFLYEKRRQIRNRLKWVPTGRTYHVMGHCDMMDPTKSLEVMSSLLSKGNGLSYIEVLTRPVLLISDPKVLEWLLLSNTILQKSKAYEYLQGWLEGGLLISEVKQWRSSRKILNPAFHFGALEQYVGLFEKPTQVFLDILRKQVGKAQVDLCPYVTRFTLDVTCQTAMGVQMDVQQEWPNEYVNAVDSMCALVVNRTFNPIHSFDFLYQFTSYYAEEKKHLKLLHEVSNRIIEKRRKEIDAQLHEDTCDGVGSKRKMALLDLLLKYRDGNGNPLPNSFIRREVDALMFAGHDTTASALSFALYCLANHTDVQTKARSEVDEVLADSDTITSHHLQEMRYLELVVKETLRLYPTVPYYSRITTEDVAYEGNKVVPKGVALTIVAYAINRNPQVYDHPDEFIPTRFLNSNNKPFSYLPFSAGPRNCIGQKFATLEMKFALAKILQNFHLAPATPNVEIILSAEIVLKSKSGVHISLKERSGVVQ